MSSRNVGFGPRFVAPVPIGPVLNPIDTTMISEALVPIARDLDIASSVVIWLVAGLYLASAITQPTAAGTGTHGCSGAADRRRRTHVTDQRAVSSR